MRHYRFVSIGFFLLWLFCGCALHYHRSDQSGVTFYLRRPDAKTVFLLSSLNGFAPRAAEHKGGRWINSLPDGREFRYFYLVDGHLFIPACRLKEKDDFGQENCVYVPRM
jgi:hypothetical protein